MSTPAIDTYEAGYVCGPSSLGIMTGVAVRSNVNWNTTMLVTGSMIWYDGFAGPATPLWQPVQRPLNAGCTALSHAMPMSLAEPAIVAGSFMPSVITLGSARSASVATRCWRATSLIASVMLL